MTEKILIVEDDPRLSEGLAYNLDRAGYEVCQAADGITGLELALSEAPDLIVLDLMLPGRSGMEILGDLRKAGRAIPVIILSAIDDEVEKVRGFGLGAIDYVTKPFGVAELLARIRVRLSGHPGADPETVALGTGTARLSDFIFERDGVEHPLTPTEVDILRYLAARIGGPVRRDDLVRAIWGLGAHSTRTLDTHVARLRKKIEPDPAHPRHLVTVHGVGYRLVS